MPSFIIFLVAICCASARVFTDDADPYKFGLNTPEPLDTDQGKVLMKEVTLYLTPSQIKAFEASQGQNNQDQYSEQDIENIEAEIKKQLERQNIYVPDNNNNDKRKNLSPPPVQESVEENPLELAPQFQPKWQPLPSYPENPTPLLPPAAAHPQNHQFAESYSYVKFYTDEEVHETPKLQQYHPFPLEKKVDPELENFYKIQNDPSFNKQFKLIPYEYSTTPEPEKLEKINPFSAHDEKYQDSEKDFPEFKYVPQIGEQKSNDDEIGKFFINIEKENALARAEAVLQAPPAPTRKEVDIKRRPFPYSKFSPSAIKNKPYFERFSGINRDDQVEGFYAHKPTKITVGRHVRKN